MKTLDIFKIEENSDGEILYNLVNKHGRKISGAVWNKKPMLQSGIFLTTENKIYTVLGDEVKSFVADKIYCILNFWVYYRIGNQDFIARLEPLGLKFRIKAETPVTHIGYLSYDGCVIENNDSWEIYTYSFGALILDERIPDVIISADRIDSILKAGFTPEYLITLTDDIYLQRSIMSRNTMLLWKQANEDFYNIVIKFSELIQEYSAEKIGSTLGLRPYIVTVIVQYLEVIKFIEDSDNSL